MKSRFRKTQVLLEEALACEDHRRRASLLVEAVRLDPDNAEAFQELGKCYLYLGELELADEALQIALDLEDDGWTHLLRGNLKYHLGDLAAAEAEYVLSLETLRGVAVPLWCIGDVRWAAGDLAGSEAYFRQAVALDPNEVGALARLGRFLVCTDRSEEGEPYLRDALATDPSHPNAIKWSKEYLNEETP
jgi:tetratricopeptide (TPR) repeat protein